MGGEPVCRCGAGCVERRSVEAERTQAPRNAECTTPGGEPDASIAALGDRLYALLQRRGPLSHQAAAYALDADVTAVNAAAVSQPRMFCKIRVGHGPRQQTTTLLTALSPADSHPEVAA
jgi:hypothetical protein